MTNSAFTELEIRVGVLLDEAVAAGAGGDGLDETGHAPASGYRGEHRAGIGRRVAVLGDDVLRAAATAVGQEVATVLSGVAAGIERRSPSGAQVGSFDIGDVTLKFGVKAVLGVGRAVEALLSASSEATVEVVVSLRPRVGGSGS
jgi:hypothetical protein